MYLFIWRKAVLLGVVMMCYSLKGMAQQHTKDTTDYTQKPVFDDRKERSKAKFRFIPMPSYSPTTELGLTLIEMIAFYPNKEDLVSPPSTLTFGAFGSTNTSWSLFASPRLFLKEDKWRVTSFLAYANIRQELDFGEIRDVDVRRKIVLASVDVKRRVFERLFVGGGYQFTGIKYDGVDEEDEQSLILVGFSDQVRNHAVKGALTWDNRDNIFYPYKGMYIEYQANYIIPEGGSGDFVENKIIYKQFATLFQDTDHVLGWNVHARFLGDNAENENYSFYGRSGAQSQRGYEVGTYIDRNLLSTEIEYRRQTPLLKRKLGFVAFTGLGKVFGDYNSFGDAEWLPVGGVGVRYRILPYERMNVRTDFAVGKDGFTWYFGVREAF
ncbi:BamA/TamA family outer membrane protein [Algivirga pacifica]|uniref:Bacterial surface antigen (D15) domain-containing protein n=1 Tax=Algivirga pacifica TaxID=1162670 RepID=A0ABP9DJ37_9BACT